SERHAHAERWDSERRAAHEQEAARQTQARLFPQLPPPLKTLAYKGVCLQAREVGGDYYDFLDLGRERVGLVIGDVSGKGTPAALVFRNDGNVERLDSTCTVLGLTSGWDCSVGDERLFPGDTLALYTDGVTESFNDGGEEFGEGRLIETLRRHRELPPEALLASLAEGVRQFSPHEQHDDITLVVAHCR